TGVFLRDDARAVRVQLHHRVSLGGVGRRSRVTPDGLQTVVFRANLLTHDPHSEAHNLFPSTTELASLTLTLLHQPRLRGPNRLSRSRVVGSERKVLWGKTGVCRSVLPQPLDTIDVVAKLGCHKLAGLTLGVLDRNNPGHVGIQNL